jgi:hypothetical protein
MTGWEISDVETVPSIELAMPRAAEFAQVVCSDRDLLRAEFDAIIAANWANHKQLTPPPPRSGSVPGFLSADPDPECSAVDGRVLRPIPVRPVPAWPRERSPPTPATSVSAMDILTVSRKDGDRASKPPHGPSPQFAPSTYHSAIEAPARKRPR